MCIRPLSFSAYSGLSNKGSDLELLAEQVSELDGKVYNGKASQADVLIVSKNFEDFLKVWVREQEQWSYFDNVLDSIDKVFDAVHRAISTSYAARQHPYNHLESDAMYRGTVYNLIPYGTKMVDSNGRISSSLNGHYLLLNKYAEPRLPKHGSAKLLRVSYGVHRYSFGLNLTAYKYDLLNPDYIIFNTQHKEFMRLRPIE